MDSNHQIILVIIITGLNICGSKVIDTTSNRIIENVVFTRQSSVQIALRHWQVAFTMDFNDLRSAATSLLAGINFMAEHKETGLPIEIFQNSSLVDYYNDILLKQHTDIMVLKSEVLRYLTKLSSVSHLYDSNISSKRRRRAIVPFIGQFSEWLLGTVSEQSLDRVQHRLEALENTNLRLKHFIDESITALNITYVMGVQNRDAINNLIDVTSALAADMQIMATNIHAIMGPISQFVLEYLQCHEILYQGKILINRLEVLYTDRLNHITEISNGALPADLIPPKQLHAILVEIKDNLPLSLVLPFDVDTKLANYYQIIHTAIISRQGSFLVTCTLPLLDSSEQFHVYKAVPLDIPPPGQDTNLDLVARINLDTPFFMVSSDRTKYVLLDEVLFKTCSQSGLLFCSINAAVYSTNDNTDSCVINLFMKGADQEGICDIKIRKKLFLNPEATSISQNAWVVSSNKQTIFTIRCPHQEDEYITLRPPIAVIELNSGCTGISHTLTLPAHYIGSSRINLQDKEALNISYVKKFWKHLDLQINISNIELPDKLMPLDKEGVSIKRLKRQADDFYQNNLIMENACTLTTKIILVAISVLITLTIIVLGACAHQFMKAKSWKRFNLKMRKRNEYLHGELYHTTMIPITSVKDSFTEESAQNVDSVTTSLDAVTECLQHTADIHEPSKSVTNDPKRPPVNNKPKSKSSSNKP